MKTKGNISHCDDLIELIQHQLRFLFDLHQFEICSVSAYRQGEYCLVVLESPTFRIRFLQERNSLQIAVGGKDAHLDWGDTKKDSQVWHNLIYTADYIAGRPRKTRGEISEMGKKLFPMTVSEKMKMASDLLKPNIRIVTDIFTGKSEDFSLKELSNYVWSERQ